MTASAITKRIVFRGRPITTRLANVLRAHEITTLPQLKEILTSGKFKFFSNAGPITEIEALELCGMKPNIHVAICRFCGRTHTCKPKLRSVPAEQLDSMPVEKVRVEFFKNVIVSGLSAREEVSAQTIASDFGLVMNEDARKNGFVIYCRTPEEAGELKMRLRARLDPL